MDHLLALQFKFIYYIFADLVLVDGAGTDPNFYIANAVFLVFSTEIHYVQCLVYRSHELGVYRARRKLNVTGNVHVTQNLV